MYRLKRLVSINFSAQGRLKTNFSGHRMHDEGGYILKGEYVVGGCTFLEPQPMAKGGGQHAVGNCGLKEAASSKNLGEAPQGYGLVASLPLF